MNERFSWKFLWEFFYKHLWTAAFDHTLDNLGIAVFFSEATARKMNFSIKDFFSKCD